MSEPPDETLREAPEPAGAAGGGRPGRFRRWVVRPLFWGLLLLVLLLAGLYLFVESPYAHRRAAALVIARLSETLQRDVQVGGIEYDFYPLAVELRDVVVPGPEPDDPAVATVPLLRLEFSWRDLRQRVLALERIEVERPQVYIRFNPDGTSNLPEIKRGPQRARRVEVRIGHILVQDGSVTIDEQKLPLEVEARAIWGRLIGGPDDRLEALLTAQEVTTTLPDANPYPFALSVKGSFEPGLIRIAAARVTAPELRALAAGRFAWAEGRRSLELDVDADGAAQLANRLGYMEQPIAGTFAMGGRLELENDLWTYRAEVTSPRVDVLDRVVSAVRAQLTAEPDGIRVDVEEARYAGGSVTGLVTVDLGGPGDAGAGDGAAGRPVELDLELVGLDIEALLADQDLPIAGLSGSLGGDLDYRFTTEAPFAGSGWADLSVQAVQRANRRLPIAGEIPLVIEGGVVSSAAARLTAPSQTVVGSGTFDLERLSGRIEYRLSTTDLGVLAAVVPAELAATDAGAGPPVWLPTAGRGEVLGTLAFGDGSFAAGFDLDLSGVATPGLAVDTLSGTLEVRPEAIENLRLEATRQGGALMATGRVPLPEDGKAAAGPLALALDVHEWPLASLAGLLPVAVAGSASGRIDLAGTFESLSGQADLTASALAVAGYELGRAEAHAAFAGPAIEVQRVVLETPAGLVLARGTLDRAAEQLAFTLDAPALALDAPPFAEALPADLEGTLAVEAAVEGSFDRPSATVAVRGRDLVLGGRPVGEAGSTEILASWDGERVSANGSLLGLVGFNGGGLLTRDRAEVAFDVRSSSLGELVRIATPAGAAPLPGLTGSFLGSLTAGAEFAARSYRAELHLAELEATYEGHEITNLEPVVVALTPEGVWIESIYLGEPATETELFVSGTIGLGETKPLDLRVQSTISAVWAEAFLPDFDVDGQANLLANVRGTVSDPAINGQASLDGARVILPDFPHALEDVDAIVLFYGADRVTLDNLTARFGGGRVRASGRLDLPRAGRELAYRFQVQGDDVSLRYPEGFLIRGDAELSFVSERGGTRQVSGAVELDRAFYLQDLELGTFELLRGVFERERLEVPETNELLATTQLNVAVDGPDALRVRNNVANFSGDVDLVIRGTLARPVVFGEVELEPGGTLVFRDNEYEIERGTLTFANPYRLDPAIDLVATTEVRSYDITLTLSGTIDSLNPSFSSDADLADLEVLALLTGAPLDEAGQLRQRDPTEAQGPGGAAGFLYGQAASALSERVTTLFGFDRFRIDPLAASGGDSVSAVRVTVGKRISRDLFVTYSRDPSTDEGDIVVAEWQVADNVVLIFTGNGDGTFAVDAQWETRY